jgi:hypothetical protein
MMNRLILHTEIIAIYCENYIKYINAVSGQNSVTLYYYQAGGVHRA